ncbi:MAG TPA: hypothetical protein VFI65_14265, partial [Streptosporangiaceae bacterium]|nr:hypothetical protein [Streptosporangiaceae bacterium]
PSFTVGGAVEDYRMTPDGTSSADLAFPSYNFPDMWEIPSQPGTVGAFDFSSEWDLSAPTLTMSVVAPKHLTLQAQYPNYIDLDQSFAEFSGNQTLPVVDAGVGSAQDFAGINARGKLALIHLDTLSGCLVESSQLQHALQAGAAGVLVAPTLTLPSGEPFTCPVPLEPQSFFGQGPEVNIPFVSVPAAEATSLRGLLAHGTVRVNVAALAISPYQYDLKFYAEGKMPSSTAYTVTDHTVTAVHANYHSAQAAFAEPFDAVFAPDEFFVGGVTDALPAPAAQTEYYGPASPAVVWQRFPGLFADDAVLDAGVTYDVFGQPGNGRTEDWFGSPAAPGSIDPPQDVFQAQPGKFDGSAPSAFCAGCRQGDTFYPLFYKVLNSDPRLTDGPFGFTSDNIHLFHDGQEIQPISFAGIAAYQLPAQRATYQLKANFFNTATDWQFTSGQPASNQVPDGFACVAAALTGSTDPCEVDPLIFLRYNAFTSLTNAVSAAATHQIQVTPSYQAPVAPAKITSLRLWISTDGGTTWQQEQTRVHDGTYTASYHVPALSATSGWVSVRVQATDSAGDTVSQTISNAYAITN